ncbi:MAG TPA: hypothetical protein VE178_11465 [Silvibacterium sp.]|nr:hypothetical protein [Silvibacterium sp.]
MFFNLLWLALSASLFGLWLLGRSGGSSESLDVSIRRQVTALAVLIAVLFPVVSLTDDLLAWTTPMEVEHLVRRDLQDHPGGRVDTGAIGVTVFFSFDRAAALQTFLHLLPSIEIGTPREDYLNTLGDRSPPRA